MDAPLFTVKYCSGNVDMEADLSNAIKKLYHTLTFFIVAYVCVTLKNQNEYRYHCEFYTSTVEPLLSDPLLSEFQLSNLRPTLPTPFKPVVLAFLLSDLSIIRPNFYSPNRVG